MAVDLKNYTKKVKADWDRRAKADFRYWVVASLYNEKEFKDSAEKDMALLLSGLPDLKDDSLIFDLGCGSGRMIWALRQRFKYVYGVDVSEEMIRSGQKWLKENGCDPNAIFVNNGTDLGFIRSSSFDLVYSYAALQHVPKTVVANYFLEITRVLKPGGFFCFQCWIGESNTISQGDTLNMRVYSESEISKMTHHLPLEEISRNKIDYYDPLLKLYPYWITIRKNSDFSEEQLEQKNTISFTEGEFDKSCETEARLFYYHAEKLAENGDSKGSLKMLDLCIESDPDYIPGYLKKGDLLIELGEFDEGLTVYEELLKRDDGKVYGLLRIAQVQFTAGFPQDAAFTIKTLNKIDSMPQQVQDAADELHRVIESSMNSK